MHPIEVSFTTFETLVVEKSYKQLVVLDISAHWCAPCKVLQPILTKVVSEYNKDIISLAKLEAEDENMKIAGRFSVRGFPTVIAFVRGKESARFHSSQTPNFVRGFIDKNLEIFRQI